MLLETERKEQIEQLLKIEKMKEKQRKLSLFRPNSKPNSRAQSCVNSPRNVPPNSDLGKNINLIDKFEKFEKVEKFDFQIQSEKKAALRNQSRKSSRVQNDLTIFYDDRDYYGNQMGGNNDNNSNDNDNNNNNNNNNSNCNDIVTPLIKTENKGSLNGVLSRVNSRTFNRSRPPSPTPSVLVEALQTLVLNENMSGSGKTKKNILNKFSYSSRDSGKNTDYENVSDDEKSKNENENEDENQREEEGEEGEEEEEEEEEEGEDCSVDGSIGEISAVSCSHPSPNQFSAATGINNNNNNNNNSNNSYYY